jgi:hypothetical protein
MIDGLIELYNTCKYKNNILSNNREKKWYKFLVNGDIKGLRDFLDYTETVHGIKILTLPLVKIIKTDNGSTYKTFIKLFNIIPIFSTIKQNDVNNSSFKFYLFCFIPIMKLKTSIIEN